MANYCELARTNYFKVTDEEKLNEIIAQCHGNEDTIHLCHKIDANGTKRFMFYCEGSILGFRCDEDFYNYDSFCSALQKILPEDEAIMITEIGHEKMRYLYGGIVVITKDNYQCQNLDRIGRRIAKDMLGNKDWHTQNEG